MQKGVTLKHHYISIIFNNCITPIDEVCDNNGQKFKGNKYKLRMFIK